MKYHCCSDGCKHIFDNEPEKYSQAWLPVHQILPGGNCFPEDVDPTSRFQPAGRSAALVQDQSGPGQHGLRRLARQEELRGLARPNHRQLTPRAAKQERHHGCEIHRPYEFEQKDTVDKFPAPLLYIGWEDHKMLCAPFCVPMPPTMKFGELVQGALPGMYGAHPDFAKIDWSQAEWFLSGQTFQPDMDKTLAENGIGHKAPSAFAHRASRA